MFVIAQTVRAFFILAASETSVGHHCFVVDLLACFALFLNLQLTKRWWVTGIVQYYSTYSSGVSFVFVASMFSLLLKNLAQALDRGIVFYTQP